MPSSPDVRRFHPVTAHFPPVVGEGMLIEPTEIETLDTFADALIAIAAEAESGPRPDDECSQTAPVLQLDGAIAARQPNLRWCAMTGYETPCRTE